MSTWDFSMLPVVMDRYARGFHEALEGAVHIITDTGHREIVEGTPILTGRAVDNWVVTFGHSFGGYREDGYSIGSGQGLKGKVIVEGRDEIYQWRLDTNNDLYMTNNSPYIGALNDGRSSQGGAFVERGIAAMSYRAKSIRLIKRV